MLIREIEISGYRSVKDFQLQLSNVTVLVGPNGCGKSNIYQAIHLLAAAASGRFARRIVEEGGIKSILWAGRRGKLEDPRIRLAITLEELQYELEFGRVPKSDRLAGKDEPGLSPFRHDPDIKYENIHFLNDRKRIALLTRERGAITARNMDGRSALFPANIEQSESVLSELKEPHKFPELSTLRTELGKWRFYHDFRTDLQSPIRQSRMGTLTTVLDHDGSDLPAAIATIQAIGDAEAFKAAVDSAFPGSSVSVDFEESEFTLYMSVPGMYRQLNARELSDGTLQYLCLLTALLSPRPASFVVLNEPETSIHPDLYKPLAELIALASKHSQILLTTHSQDLALFLKQSKADCHIVELEKFHGATQIAGKLRKAQSAGKDRDRDEDEHAQEDEDQDAS